MYSHGILRKAKQINAVFLYLNLVSHAEESELKEGVSLACSLITVENLRSGGAFLGIFLTMMRQIPQVRLIRSPPAMKEPATIPPSSDGLKVTDADIV